jgi:carbonic anhydrase
MTPRAEIVEVTSVEQLEHVRELFQLYQSGLPSQYRFPDGEWQELPGAYGPPRGALLLATFDGRPAGCIGLRPFPLEGACEMKRLYVLPEFRGAQLGRALIEAVLNLGRNLGYVRMRLDTHIATMGAAAELYRRLGFVEVLPDPLPPIDGLSYMELRL